MAVRDRATHLFQGGIGQWVSVDEASEIAMQFAALETVGELAEWLDSPTAVSLGNATAVLGYRARLGAVDDPFVGGPLALGLIVSVAACRRRDAIRAYAGEKRLSMTTSPAARCATCNAHLNTLSVSAFYCDVHRDDQDAELAHILDPTTGFNSTMEVFV